MSLGDVAVHVAARGVVVGREVLGQFGPMRAFAAVGEECRPIHDAPGDAAMAGVERPDSEGFEINPQTRFHGPRDRCPGRSAQLWVDQGCGLRSGSQAGGQSPPPP